MTDEQFKAWAKSFLERTDTYTSWRGAAVEAIGMIEDERKKNETLVALLHKIFANAQQNKIKADLSTYWILMGEVKEALAENATTSEAEEK